VFIERVPEESLPEQEEAPPTVDRILLVEDNSDLRQFIAKMLRRMGHEVIAAADGLQGWECVQKERPDLVVSDVMMPQMDGYELLQMIKTTEQTRYIPVILITAKPGLDPKIKGLEIGADDYLPKPINVRELDARITNLITMRKFQAAVAESKALDVRMEELGMGFAQSLEIRDFKTGGHSRDVLALGSIIAEEMDLPMDRNLKESLLLHDIGKIGIPDRILLKKNALDEDEWIEMKKHSEIGYDLLKTFDSFSTVSQTILAHQEHFDGSGYPKGLSGEKIPLHARIIGVADAYHAMTSDRPYRKALSVQVALSELLKHRGRQFDPQVADAFIAGLLRKKIVSPQDLDKAEKILR
jgi:response regulator RpfG family c-di-GMP phosphodiesterase